jgi:hypothetical protein
MNPFWSPLLKVESNLRRRKNNLSLTSLSLNNNYTERKKEREREREREPEIASKMRFCVCSGINGSLQTSKADEVNL